MGNKLVNVAATEAHQPLAAAMKKFGRAWHSLADLDHAQVCVRTCPMCVFSTLLTTTPKAISECVILGDSLGYQGLNAKSAKVTSTCLLDRARA